MYQRQDNGLSNGMGDAERCDARSNEGAAQVGKAVVAEGGA
ncbi:MAG: hypothetical protein VW779_11280 [Halieaceae bacterium]